MVDQDCLFWWGWGSTSTKSNFGRAWTWKWKALGPFRDPEVETELKAVGAEWPEKRGAWGPDHAGDPDRVCLLG